MRALDDFHMLTQHLQAARLARATARDMGVGQHRRDQATVAYGRALDCIFDLLDRLDREPMLASPQCKPTLAVLAETLSAIDQGEKVLGRLK